MKKIVVAIDGPAGAGKSTIAKLDAEKLGYAYNWERLKTAFEQYFGPYQQILSTDTLQFADYSQYASSVFDVKHKHNVHDIQFPKDKVKAFDLGRSLAESVRPMK